MILNAETGQIDDVNPYMIDMLHYSLEEFVGMKFWDVSPFKDTVFNREAFEELQDKGYIRYKDLPLETKEGKPIAVEFVSNVYKVNGDKVIQCNIRNITERKQAEEALKESEERYRNQVESINDVAYAIDGDGKYTYISPVVTNILGYEPDEMIGRQFLEFVHEEDHDLLARKFSELCEGVVSRDEYRIIGKSGDVKWVRSHTNPILDIGGFAGGRGILADISEKKLAEKALNLEKENFRRSLDESPLGVRIVTEAGETIYANRAILGIYGYDTIDELQTTPLKNRYTRESYAEFRIRREKRRQGLDDPSEYTIDIIRKNGDVRHLRVFRKDILWDNARQYQVIYQDITERKQAMEELAAKSQQLEQTNTALQILLQHREEDLRQTEQKIVTNLQKLVFPYVEELRKHCLSPIQSNYLNIIDSNLQQVINPFLQNLSTRFSVLTPREIQISSLIKEGKTTKEIADLIKAAPRSVESHRDNIRKKLGLSGKKTNLRSFLITLS